MPTRFPINQRGANRQRRHIRLSHIFNNPPLLNWHLILWVRGIIVVGAGGSGSHCLELLGISLKIKKTRGRVFWLVKT